MELTLNFSNCTYCKEHLLTHVSSADIIYALDQINHNERAVIVNFIDQITRELKFHTAIAVRDVKDSFCKFCGSCLIKEAEDDRYIYLCLNKDCVGKK